MLQETHRGSRPRGLATIPNSIVKPSSALIIAHAPIICVKSVELGSHSQDLLLSERNA
jgi:hypothetical protein